MMLQEFADSGMQFFNLCTVYYAVQLVRCAFLSLAVYALVIILRKTGLKNHVFLKGTLWSMFIPVLFAGKMKFFYENSAGVKLFSWLTEICMNHLWLCRLYLCGVFLYGALLIRRRGKLKKMTACMEKRNVDGTLLYVTDLPVTPSAVGVFRPKLIMPEAILEEYDKEEFQTILLHEKTHIQLGHLLFYLLWDILRVLLWINPFLSAGVKFFRQDMEEICDWVTIQRSRGKAYMYGQLLLKSIRVLQAEGEDFNMYATFAGDRSYENVRQRITRIARYQPYKRIETIGTLILAALCIMGALLWIRNVSYSRWTSYDRVAVYDERTETLFINSEILKEAVSYDENYIYIESKALKEFMKNSGISGGKICIYFGGYYKLPGIGGGGNCGYLDQAGWGENLIKIGYTRQNDIFDVIFKII